MRSSIPLALSYNDVLLVPQKSSVNSRSDVDLTTKITKRITLKLPIISTNMTDVTGIDMAVSLGKLGGVGFLPRFFSIEKQSDMVKNVKKEGVIVGAAVGAKENEIERAEALVAAGCNILTLDVAHGAMLKAIEATKVLKRKFGKSVDIISGVIATYEGAVDLFKAGADSVRVGVGPGTICTTRIVTGVGVPQISAVIEAKRAAVKYKRTVICDGGTSNTGDIMKGLAAGASAVIIGSQLAGCDEAQGKLVEIKGKRYKQYNASTSYTEKIKHTENGSNCSSNYIKHVEGIESFVPYSGSLVGVIEKLISNLQSGFSYTGAKNISELHKKARFVRITSGGLKESAHHNVIHINS